MRHRNLARCAALGATILFAACSGTSNVTSTPATHAPFGSYPGRVVVANASGATIIPEVEPDCWTINPPFSPVKPGKDSQPVNLGATCGDSTPPLVVEYGGVGGQCTLNVMSDGRTFTWHVGQGSATKCTVSSTANGELFTYALK
jgi:hypothetical protein